MNGVMKVLKALLASIAVTIGIALLASRRRPAVSMHELDWCEFGEGMAPRCYRSVGHASHHLKELAGLALPLTEVYVLRTLTPAFREQIMIVTAMADQCSA